MRKKILIILFSCKILMVINLNLNERRIQRFNFRFLNFDLFCLNFSFEYPWVFFHFRLVSSFVDFSTGHYKSVTLISGDRLCSERILVHSVSSTNPWFKTFFGCSITQSSQVFDRPDYLAAVINRHNWSFHLRHNEMIRSSLDLLNKWRNNWSSSSNWR